ncbi:GSCFA domain-containing protein [Ekhidna sp.]|uniref:GSCFA domain-containing protein n=1 Tax=Ekhidna sp. TaxID=2608089 RepID=UPI003514FACC
MFKLNFDIPKSEDKIRLSDPIYLMGSCFSDEIGTLLKDNKFDTLSNPFGTIYNPISLFKLLQNDVQVDNLIESHGVFYHWDAHGSISGLSSKKTIESFRRQVDLSNEFLTRSKWLIITLGTSIVYELKDSSIVANCHKVPSSSFSKRFLNHNEIMERFNKLYSYLRAANSELNIIFTVSPVRHVRDGLVENNRSKAILIDAVHEIVEPYENVSYFPSFEIVMDELRDYRFFKPDMIHPSDQAILYVWKRFVETYFDNESKAFLDDWEKLKSAIKHKPFQPKSNSHQQFIKSTLSKLEKLNQKVNVSVEIEELKKQLL